jgi:hypothetical protein
MAFCYRDRKMVRFDWSPHSKGTFFIVELEKLGRNLNKYEFRSVKGDDSYVVVATERTILSNYVYGFYYSELDYFSAQKEK